ncbi:MAG: hypothetical protein EB084_17220 [Proteobacteria bacterium]|nr:hypothetical protein [Pseudomonadota bacterium]
MQIGSRPPLSPWLTSSLPARSVTAAQEHALGEPDRTAIGPPPAPISAAASSPVASRPSVLATVVLGLSVAASMASASPPVTSLSHSVAASTQPLVATDSASQREQRINALLADSGGSPADLEKARNSLSRVPDEVLTALTRHATRIRIIQPGQTPRDAGVVTPVSLDAYSSPSLVPAARAALARINQIYSSRISTLQGQVVSLERQAGSAPPSADLILARQKLASLQQQRDVVARREVQEATGHLLEPAMTAEAVQMGRLARVAPVSLRDLADGCGATTRREREEIATLITRLNGPRIEQAQRAYGVDESSLPPDQRSMMAYDAELLVPTYTFVRVDGQGSTERIANAETESLQAWKSGAVRGEYRAHTVMVRADALGPQEGGRDVLLHELGHAFEDSHRADDPAHYDDYALSRDLAFRRAQESPGHPYHGRHAAEAPGEVAAETFADVLTHRDARLRKADPAWLRAFDAWSGLGTAPPSSPQN